MSNIWFKPNGKLKKTSCMCRNAIGNTYILSYMHVSLLCGFVLNAIEQMQNSYPKIKFIYGNVICNCSLTDDNPPSPSFHTGVLEPEPNSIYLPVFVCVTLHRNTLYKHSNRIRNSHSYGLWQGSHSSQEQNLRNNGKLLSKQKYIWPQTFSKLSCRWV